MRIHLITAESPESRRLRYSRLIQFPQLTMPLLAALTPPDHEVYHTDEIVEPVRFDRPAGLVGITAPTPSALHAYKLADEFRRRRVPVVIGGPHATALPEEALAHADAVVAGTEWAARRFYSWSSIGRRMRGSQTGLWWNLPRNLGYHLALAQYPFAGWNPARRRGRRPYGPAEAVFSR